MLCLLWMEYERISLLSKHVIRNMTWQTNDWNVFLISIIIIIIPSTAQSALQLLLNPPEECELIKIIIVIALANYTIVEMWMPERRSVLCICCGRLQRPQRLREVKRNCTDAQAGHRGKSPPQQHLELIFICIWNCCGRHLVRRAKSIYLILNHKNTSI